MKTKDVFEVLNQSWDWLIIIYIASVLAESISRYSIRQFINLEYVLIFLLVTGILLKVPWKQIYKSVRKGLKKLQTNT